MVALSNPVAQAVIRPPGSPLIVGSFRVTAAFGVIDASHPTPHQGVDIGNGKCGEPVLAMADGTVSSAGLLGTAKVVRIAHPQYPGYETGYAHLASIEVAKGQGVKRGQRIGTLGATGASSCHLHIGCKLNGVEVDSWPLLIQNGAMEDDVLQGTNPRRVENAKVVTSTGSDDLRVRSAPFTTGTVLVSLPNGTELHPDYLVDGTKVGAAADPRWYGVWVKPAAEIVFGYVSVVFCSAPEPIEQADCTAAVKAATDPLNTKISKAKLLVDGAKAALA